MSYFFVCEKCNRADCPGAAIAGFCTGSFTAIAGRAWWEEPHVPVWRSEIEKLKRMLDEALSHIYDQHPERMSSELVEYFNKWDAMRRGASVAKQALAKLTDEEKEALGL